MVSRGLEARVHFLRAKQVLGDTARDLERGIAENINYYDSAGRQLGIVFNVDHRSIEDLLILYPSPLLTI